MKCILKFCVLIILIGCNSSSPTKYNSFNGVEYAICGDFYNGRIFIKEINKLSIKEIIEFAYCYTEQNKMEGLVIESDYYPAHSFWIGKKKGHALYKIQFGIVDISESETEIQSQKEVTFVLQNINNKLVEVPKRTYNNTYVCK